MKIDVSDDIELKNRKSLPTGWSQSEVWHDGKRIGWFESGYPMDFKSPYSFELKEEGKNSEGQEVTRCIIYKEAT